MKSYVACLALLAFTATAQISVPRVGSARFDAGRIFAVQGIPANLLVADAPWTTAQAVSFSDSGGLLATDGTITLVNPEGFTLATYTSSETAPVLDIESGLSSAIAWLPSTHALLYWNSSAWVYREVNDAGRNGVVTCIQITAPQTARLLLAHADLSVSALTISLDSGQIISSDLLPSAHGRTFAQGSFFLSQDEHGLIAESATGVRRSIELTQTPLPEGDLTIERMSSHWLHIFSATTHRRWALYLNGANLAISILPTPAVKEAAR